MVYIYMHLFFLLFFSFTDYHFNDFCITAILNYIEACARIFITDEHISVLLWQLLSKAKRTCSDQIAYWQSVRKNMQFIWIFFGPGILTGRLCML